MTFINAIKSFWVNYADFKGRTSPNTYWFALLFWVIATTILANLFPGQQVQEADLEAGLNSIYENSMVVNIWRIATVVPLFAIGARRLHDAGHKATWLLWILFPIVGWIVLLIKLLNASQPGENAYGTPEQK